MAFSLGVNLKTMQNHVSNRLNKLQMTDISILQDEISVPAWKSLPSWYMSAANNEAIPPDAERLFAQRMGATAVEVEASHVPMASQPDAVADLIKIAAASVSAE